MKLRNYKQPISGDVKRHRGFALWPITISRNTKVWFEFYTRYEIYTELFNSTSGRYVEDEHGWFLYDPSSRTRLSKDKKNWHPVRQIFNSTTSATTQNPRVAIDESVPIPALPVKSKQTEKKEDVPTMSNRFNFMKRNI